MPDHIDTNARSYWGVTGLSIIGETINGSGMSEALKFSLCQDIFVSGCKLWGGDEDCVDAVRGANYHFVDCDMYVRGDFAMTLKGGIDGVKVENCRFWGAPNEVAIDLGNWSKYNVDSLPPVRHVEVRDCAFDIKAKTAVRAMYADIPVLSNNKTSGKPYWRMPKLFVSIFFWCRKKGWFAP